MKTTRKLLVVLMAAVLAAVSFVPSTFSWYTHSGSADGYRINYTGEHPISIKSAGNTLNMSTMIADANGIASSTGASFISVAPNTVTYYKTTFTNSGTNDVYVDFYTKNLPNNADFVIGTVSPTINEKAYASRPIKTKVSSDFVRVYFETNSNFYPYWTHYVSSEEEWDSSLTNDMNVAYKTADSDRESYKKLLLCDGQTLSDTERAWGVKFYADLPSNTEYFYFFNHWFLASETNKEWNRTININNLSPGKLYSMTGKDIDGKYKEYSVNSNDDTNLVAVNSYYSDVRLSLGTSVYADIGLQKTSNAEDFVPEYYGSNITYTSSASNIASVNRDGRITPISQGTATITTTITGRYGDVKTVTTTVNIPEKISEVPIITNVKVPAKSGDENGTAVVDWYAMNKSKSENAIMSTEALYINI